MVGGSFRVRTRRSACTVVSASARHKRRREPPDATRTSSGVGGARRDEAAGPIPDLAILRSPSFWSAHQDVENLVPRGTPAFGRGRQPFVITLPLRQVDHASSHGVTSIRPHQRCQAMPVQRSDPPNPRRHALLARKPPPVLAAAPSVELPPSRANLGKNRNGSSLPRRRGRMRACLARLLKQQREDHAPPHLRRQRAGFR
jgi:hypothetical protein